MAKAWPQVGGFTFFSSLVTKAQMTPLSPLDLELGTRLQVKNHLVLGGGDTIKPNRRAVRALLL